MRRNKSHKRRSGISVALLFTLFAGLLSGCAKQEIKNMDSKGANIICFGDSITFGYGAEAGGDYPAELTRLLGRHVINAGIDGDTTIEALKRIESDVLRRNPYLVIIEFGGNDFLRKISKEVTISNIQTMIDKVHATGAIVALVDISAGLFLKEYRGAYRNVARQKGAIFVSGILNGIITNPSLKSDFIHPNKEGYKLIAARVYRVILPYINKSNSIEE